MDMVGWYSLPCVGGMKLVIFNKQPALQKVEEQNSRPLVSNSFQYNVQYTIVIKNDYYLSKNF